MAICGVGVRDEVRILNDWQICLIWIRLGITWSSRCQTTFEPIREVQQVFRWAAETVVLRQTVNLFPMGNIGGSNPSPPTKFWIGSSAEEQGTLNPCVVGSIPTRFTKMVLVEIPKYSTSPVGMAMRHQLLPLRWAPKFGPIAQW